MTALEDKLNRYKEPSSSTEQDKQDRAERMVRNAVDSWAAGVGLDVSYLAKGSYANNTNVKLDSDVDIAVIHGDSLYYYDDKSIRDVDKPPHTPYSQPAFPKTEFRTQLETILRRKFGSQGCDTSGNTAIEVVESSSRVKADVVPSFEHRSYFYNSAGRVAYHLGQIVFRRDGSFVINYPRQQLDNGVAKNNRTGRRYKQQVRILKRIENDLVSAKKIDELPSYFMECLVYCVPDAKFGNGGSTPLADDLQAVLLYLWNQTDTDGAGKNWYEPNGIKALFGHGQPWSMADARTLVQHAWNYCGFGS